LQYAGKEPEKIKHLTYGICFAKIKRRGGVFRAVVCGEALNLTGFQPLCFCGLKEGL
jgi:hypothetical protein